MKKDSFGEFFITILVNINNVSLNSQDFDKKYFLQRQNKKKMLLETDQERQTETISCFIIALFFKPSICPSVVLCI